MWTPPNSPWRGCSSNFHGLGSEVEFASQFLVETVYYFNCRSAPAPPAPLADIEYRSSHREYDILHHVFRWDLAPYEQVFQNGFEARRREDTPDDVYYNLDNYVHHTGRPLDSRKLATHVFICTTPNSAWHPILEGETTEMLLYRYEIYAPGGIWVNETLGDRYQCPNQGEVAFVAGIAPQYIRSAQRFRLTLALGTRQTRRERVDNLLIINNNFNPRPSRLLNLRNPISYRLDDDRKRVSLTIGYYPLRVFSKRETQATHLMSSAPMHARRERGDNASTGNFDLQPSSFLSSLNPASYRLNANHRRVPLNIIYCQPPERKKLEASTDSNPIPWYAEDVANIDTYIDAAFRSSCKNEAYLFMNNEYVLVNYAPGTTYCKVVEGPFLICDGFPSLKGTTFAEHGIDCAFGSRYGSEAFIFSGNLCAHIDYAPNTTDDKIIKGPMTITAMFPFLKGTVFESGVDAAFESTRGYQAYLFKDSQYALINFGSASRLIAIRGISQGFASLQNTMFESGFDAAFASHRYNEAYLFKGDSYARIKFAPVTANGRIIGGVKKILPNWPSLHGILPRKSNGLDVHDHIMPDAPPPC